MKFLPSEKSEYEFQMVSFVDVIFVLLSFFVLGSSFSMEKDLGLGYTQSQLAAGPRAEDFPKNIPVELRRRGRGVSIKVADAVLRDNDFTSISAKLAEINMPGITVLVVADKGLSIDELTHALDAVLLSPMKKVSLSTLNDAAGPGPAGATPTAMLLPSDEPAGRSP